MFFDSNHEPFLQSKLQWNGQWGNKFVMKPWKSYDLTQRRWKSLIDILYSLIKAQNSITIYIQKKVFVVFQSLIMKLHPKLKWYHPIMTYNETFVWRWNLITASCSNFVLWVMSVKCLMWKGHSTDKGKDILLVLE